MCCNPTPTEVYKHLPGFVKLLCSWDKSLTATLGANPTSSGTGAIVRQNSPTLVTPTLGSATGTSLVITKANAVQTGTASSGVTANGAAGVITTVSETLVSGASATFTVSDSFVTATSVIQLTLDDSANTTGVAKVTLGGVSAGQYIVKVANTHATQALNGVLKLHYLVS